MLKFSQSSDESRDIFLEDTDRPLPDTLNPNTRYMFLKTLAKGGKSVISTVRDRHLSRVVVYKSLRSEFIDDPIENRRLLREARVSAMLQHPGTIPVYEIGKDQSGHIYFTMKLVHGYTLREILDYRERYDLTQLIEVIEQVAQALAYAHDHGVAHRDIKPENILVGPYGEVLVLDWGLAKVWNKDGTTVDLQDQDLKDRSHIPKARKLEKSMTGFDSLQGTICYMSPEQINRDPNISFSTDIYSLGSVLYEVLTGQTPFESDKTYELLEMVKNEVPKKPSEVSKLPIPKTLENICLRCLQKNPVERPASMGELVRVLQQEWAGELI